MIWTNITTGTPARTANAQTISNVLPGRTMVVRASHPGSGPDALLKVVNAAGQVVSQLALSATRPEPPADYFEPVGDPNGSYNYILEPVGATWPSPGITLQVEASSVIPPLSLSSDGTKLVAPSGVAIEASSFVTNGEYDFSPLYVAGVPQIASLAIVKDTSQRVAIPAGATAIRLTFRGYGPFAYRLGDSSVTAAATDAAGSVDPTVVVPVSGAYIAVYGIGAGSLVVEAGTFLPKTGFVPVYASGAPKTASLTIAAGIAQRVALPTDCTAYRLTWRDYSPFAYRLGDSNVAAVATDAPGDVLSTVVIPAIPGATHISVYGIGAGSLVIEGGVKA